MAVTLLSARRRRGLAALALGSAFAALSCAPNADRGPRRGGTLAVSSSDTLDLDPVHSRDDFATPFLALLYEGLVRFDTTGVVRPAGASAWRVSDTGLTYTFFLRPDRCFEDGSPMVAADYVRAFKLALDPDLPGPARARFWCLNGLVAKHSRDRRDIGVSAPDPRTLVLRLSARDDVLLEKLADARYAIAKASPEREARAGHPLATGAYRAATGKDGGLLFLRNPYYRGDSPGFVDTIRVRTGVTDRRAALGLVSGAVSLVWPAPLGFRGRLGRDPRLNHVEAPAASALCWMLVLNCEMAPTASHAARYAVARGVNRQPVAEVTAPLSISWRGFAPGEAAGSWAPGFDPVAAHTALESTRRRQSISLTIQAPSGSPEGMGARALISDLGRAGIYAEIRSKPRSLYLHDLYARRAAFASIVAIRPPTSDPLSNLAELLLNRSLDERWGGNLPFYRTAGSSSIDSLLLRALANPRPAARAASLEDLEARLADEVPLVPLARVREQAYFRQELHGVRFHPRYGLELARVWTSP